MGDTRTRASAIELKGNIKKKGTFKQQITITEAKFNHKLKQIPL